MKTRQTRTVKVQDNSRVPKERFSDAIDVTAQVADKTLVNLQEKGILIFPDVAGHSVDISSDQTIIRTEGENFCTGNLIGFLGCGDERLVIESRFGATTRDSLQQTDDFLTPYLLKRVLNLPNALDLASDFSHHNPILNYLLFVFPYYLNNAMRKGLPQQYVQRRSNDARIKGPIDLDRHIKQNTPFMGNVAYTHREFSHDNSLTELIRHTIEFIYANPLGATLLSSVRNETRLVVELTPSYQPSERQRIIDWNIRNPARHTYYWEYRALQRLCLLILQHRKHQIGSGENRMVGLLFDCAWLWEEYVNLLIEDWFYHPRNKNRAGGQYLFRKAGDKSKKGQVYPDFIGKDPTTRVIADAKYKPIGNIDGRDYLQILAYMFRFDALTGFFIYPYAESSGTSRSEELYLCSGSTYERNVRARDDVSVTKLGLVIPGGAASYSDFESKMHESEATFIADLCSRPKTVF